MPAHQRGAQELHKLAGFKNAKGLLNQ